MILTVFIALDLAAFRAAFLTEDLSEIFGATTTPFEMTLMFGLPCLLAQFGLFRAIFGSTGHRPLDFVGYCNGCDRPNPGLGSFGRLATNF